MEQVIHFFKDTLNGPLYIIIAIIASILLCACIGYLAEQAINRKKKKVTESQKESSVETTISTDFSSPSPTIASATAVQAPTVKTIPEVNINHQSEGKILPQSPSMEAFQTRNTTAPINNMVQQTPIIPTIIPAQPTEQSPVMPLPAEGETVIAKQTMINDLTPKSGILQQKNEYETKSNKQITPSFSQQTSINPVTPTIEAPQMTASYNIREQEQTAPPQTMNSNPSSTILQEQKIPQTPTVPISPIEKENTSNTINSNSFINESDVHTI